MFIAFCSGALAATRYPQTSSPIALVSERPFADPYVLKDGEYFYVTGTSWGNSMFRTRTFDPNDIEWFSLHIDLGSEESLVENIWAMRLFRDRDGSYHLYGALHYGGFRTLLSHFVPAEGEKWTAEKPITHWRFDRVLVGDLKLGEYAYDGLPVRGEDGQLWLIYSSGFPREVIGVDINVKARRMRDPATLNETATMRQILSPEDLRSEDRNPNFIQILEGPIPIRLNDRLWALSYSAGDFTDVNYKFAFAFSPTLIPPEGKPYTKLYAPDKKDVWGNGAGHKEVVYTLQSEKPDWPNFCGEEIFGPGHANLVGISGHHFLVFHARIRDANGLETTRRVFKVPVQVKISGDTPRPDWIVPQLH